MVQGLCVCVRAHFCPTHSVTRLWSLPLSCEACVGRRFRNTQFGHNPCLSHLKFQRARLQRSVAEETELTAGTAEHAILCMYTPLTYTVCIHMYIRTYSYCMHACGRVVFGRLFRNPIPTATCISHCITVLSRITT